MQECFNAHDSVCDCLIDLCFVYNVYFIEIAEVTVCIVGKEWVCNLSKFSTFKSEITVGAFYFIFTQCEKLGHYLHVFFYFNITYAIYWFKSLPGDGLFCILCRGNS